MSLAGSSRQQLCDLTLKLELPPPNPRVYLLLHCRVLKLGKEKPTLVQPFRVSDQLKAIAEENKSPEVLESCFC